MGTPVIQEHSCKRCKRLITKRNKSGKSFYMCSYDQIMIKDSVYSSNECLTFINKKG